MRARLIAGAATLLALAGCDGEDPVDAALRDAAAARHAAALETTEEAEVTTPAPVDRQAQAVDAALADAEADRTRYRALADGTEDAELRRLAEAAIARREAEAAELRAWRAAQD